MSNLASVARGRVVVGEILRHLLNFIIIVLRVGCPILPMLLLLLLPLVANPLLLITLKTRIILLNVRTRIGLLNRALRNRRTRIALLSRKTRITLLKVHLRALINTPERALRMGTRELTLMLTCPTFLQFQANDV